MAEVNIHLEEEEKKNNGALLHKAEIKKKYWSTFTQDKKGKACFTVFRLKAYEERQIAPPRRQPWKQNVPLVTLGPIQYTFQ